ncbi:MAG: hypothetical protein ACKVZH_19140 [Blastocatellia bacterium]
MLTVTAILKSVLFCLMSLNSVDNGTIKGAVYDLNGSLILNIPICIENVSTGETKILKVNGDTGNYSANVPSGVYRVRLVPIVGYPMGEDRASFFVHPKEEITINFRPTPIAVTSLIENGNYISRYDGNFPSVITHFFLKTNSLTVKDINIWFYKVTKLDSTTFRYENAVATFESYTLRGAVILYDLSSGQLVAEGKVLFEDGRQTRTLKKVTFDLAKSVATIQE